MNTSQSIMATLSYHDIFKYPLTLDEIHSYLIEKKTNKNVLKNNLIQLVKKKLIVNKDKYYSLSKATINLRKKRENISITKNSIAKFYCIILALIPTVNLIAITGGLAMNNSNKKEDIDFLIITEKKSIWTSRLLANLLLFFFKRKPGEKNQENRACLNIFIDAQDLTIKDKNLYTAHELCQMKILLNRKKTYEKLLKQNKWIYKYLPNWKPIITKSSSIGIASPSVVESIFKTLQVAYMHKRVTNETISDTQLFFHPKDTQSEILKKYRKKILTLAEKI